MPGQDQTPQPPVSTAPVPAPPAGERNQVNQMRKNLVNEIKELKKQVLLVQLQSMRVMQQSIHSLFKAQTEKTGEQIALQSTGMQKHIEEETNALKATAQTDASNLKNELTDGDEQVQAFNDVVFKAMQAAQQSVDNAMAAAQQIMLDAENVLKGQ